MTSAPTYASHELRTPLTTLRAEVDFALMGDREKAELRAARERVSNCHNLLVMGSARGHGEHSDRA